jgi:uncharacterized membrane protein
MDDFMKGFTVAGLQLVLIVPFVVGGIVSWWEQITLGEMPPLAKIATVVLVTWTLLAATAVEQFAPQHAQYVRYGLAALLLPVWASGLYSGVKRVATGEKK